MTGNPKENPRSHLYPEYEKAFGFAEKILWLNTNRARRKLTLRFFDPQILSTQEMNFLKAFDKKKLPHEILPPDLEKARIASSILLIEVAAQTAAVLKTNPDVTKIRENRLSLRDWREYLNQGQVYLMRLFPVDDTRELVSVAATIANFRINKRLIDQSDAMQLMVTNFEEAKMGLDNLMPHVPA
jgi:hypothetical protein